jgi:hypothetical protein
MKNRKKKRGYYVVDVTDLKLSEEKLTELDVAIQKVVASSIIGSRKPLIETPLRFRRPGGHTDGIIADLGKLVK